MTTAKRNSALPRPHERATQRTSRAVAASQSDDTAKNVEQVIMTLGEIACIADRLRTLGSNILEETDYEDAQTVRYLAAQIGWMADLASTKLGGGELFGGAETWLLPPAYNAIDSGVIAEQD